MGVGFKVWGLWLFGLASPYVLREFGAPINSIYSKLFAPHIFRGRWMGGVRNDQGKGFTLSSGG